MRMSEDEYGKLMARRGGFERGGSVYRGERTNSADEIRKAMGVQPKPAKHGNTKVERHGIRFDSIKEADRYDVLHLDELEGRIRGLRVHVPFELAPRCVLHGKTKPALRYFADFVYEARNGDEWVPVVEDVKSPITRKDGKYRVKLHLMMTVHGIEVDEV